MNNLHFGQLCQLGSQLGAEISVIFEGYPRDCPPFVINRLGNGLVSFFGHLFVASSNASPATPTQAPQETSSTD